MIPVLDLAQQQNAGWLSLAALNSVAKLLDMAEIRVYEVGVWSLVFSLISLLVSVSASASATAAVAGRACPSAEQMGVSGRLLPCS